MSPLMPISFSSLTGITFETTFDGKAVVELTGTRKDTSAAISLTLPVS